ncbi:phosphoenolpyruvate carboxylase [Marinobacter oulmenensis]|uniref:Phosphoenolpyruvate carboxylase n=1 Tax=Marinobacter oulmenensis TaxID=643747 RepID=A0A840UL89_9GAMM|nr:phosphoenolpyruvate carboxylase [Marinobacter oulmenensis]
MSELHPDLRENVRMLGELLGQNIQHYPGQDCYERIEEIRAAAKADREHESGSDQRLVKLLGRLSDDELLPVTRAFNQFLNLVNLAEQYHGIRRNQGHPSDLMVESLGDMFDRLKDGGIDPDELHRRVADLRIEFVLTAHPTEVARRTLILKYDEMSDCLARLDHEDLLPAEREEIVDDLSRLISEAWHTDEIRHERPTAVDEAKWGFAVIENSLWEALPRFLRSMDTSLEGATGKGLPLQVSPIRIASWMGGDRDGNPNVTHEVTREVFLLGRWMAADLYLRDIRSLRAELSMWQANQELRSVVGDAREPYRQVLGDLRERLTRTRDWAEARIRGESADETDILFENEDLTRPLELCYRSLVDCGLESIANGPLLDTIRRAHTFGLPLIRLDIRQEASRHAEAVAEIVDYLGMGDYLSWSEQERQAFLIRELKGRRPLVPRNWQASDPVREVLATCEVVARQTPEALGSYVISMASQPSDVLNVILLLREAGMSFPMRVVPLFETLDDLQGAPAAMEALYQLDWYRDYCEGRQEVMIGYSDSSKDAGQLMAAWAQYQAQEKLTAVAARYDVHLTLFHGRGGTVGRGGGPANRAILSQPPGSVNGSFRITEQGEMIRFKFGLPRLAVKSLTLYASAVIEATLAPPPAPRDNWREVMDWLTERSLKSYRQVVRENPDFVPYFRQVTPETALGKLALGSRPARRKPTGGVESLRAIPWIFAWTQMRLMLPSWLGSDHALEEAAHHERLPELREMMQEWPFFRTYVDMLEMVLAKADLRIASYYEQTLVEDDSLRALGSELRERLSGCIQRVLELKEQQVLLEDEPVFAHSMKVRNPYTDPLHYLQAELLKRDRQSEGKGEVPELVERALKVTMAGISAGMRNTG